MTAEGRFAVLRTANSLPPAGDTLFELANPNLPGTELTTPMAIAASDTLVAVGFSDGRIDLFDLEFTFLHTLPRKHSANVKTLAFVAESTLLSSGGHTSRFLDERNPTGEIRAWDLSDETPRIRAELKLANEGHILALASNANDGSVEFALSVHGVRQISLYVLHEEAFTQRKLFLGTNLVNESNSFREPPSLGDGPPASAVFSPNGKRIYVGGGHSTDLGTGQLRVWDTENEEELAVITGRATANIVSLGLTNDGTRLISVATDSNSSAVIEIWDVDLPPER